MKTRWLAGLALFALGFGTAQWMKITPADASDGGMIDEGLHLFERDNGFELVNSGDGRYLVVVHEKYGVDDPQLEWVEGTLFIPRNGLIEAQVSKVRDLGTVRNTVPPYRECNPAIEDCFEPDEPIVFPRPPKPFMLKPEPRW